MRQQDQSQDLAAFISHAKEDQKAAHAIAAALEARGLKCWIAPRDVRPGRTYGDEIIKGIEHSRCFVLVLSKTSNDSAFVAREVERAISKRKLIFTVRIDPVEPSSSLELFISSTQWIDAFSDRSAEIDRLADLIAATDGGGTPRAPEVSAPPPRGAGRRGWAIGIAAVVVLAIVGGALLFSLREQEPADVAPAVATSEDAEPAAAAPEAPTAAPASEAAAPAAPVLEPSSEATAPAAPAAPATQEPVSDSASRKATELARLAEPPANLPRPHADAEDCSRSGDTTLCTSSVLPASHGIVYGPRNLTDGNDNTAWVEGRDGQGLGEFVVLDFDSPRTVRGLTIRNGYAKSPDIFAKNSRVKDVELRFSTGDSLDVTLKDEPGPQHLTLSHPVETKWVALVIRSVYPGWKYADTAINELSVDAN